MTELTNDRRLKIKSCVTQFFKNNKWLAQRLKNSGSFFSEILRVREAEKGLTKWVSVTKWRLYSTLEPPNSHTSNSHFYPNRHTLLGLTKIRLFGYVKNSWRIDPDFSNCCPYNIPEFRSTVFLILLKSSKQFCSVKFSDFLCDNLETRVFFDRESHSIRKFC